MDGRGFLWICLAKADEHGLVCATFSFISTALFPGCVIPTQEESHYVKLSIFQFELNICLLKTATEDFFQKLFRLFTTSFFSKQKFCKVWQELPRLLCQTNKTNLLFQKKLSVTIRARRACFKENLT